VGRVPGASAALVATSAVAVLAGEAISRAVPEQWIGRAAGLLFVAIGLYTLWDSFQAAP
jgi:putative Ca2+/H+ antiporter (TMEM165/GDT1 family)